MSKIAGAIVILAGAVVFSTAMVLGALHKPGADGSSILLGIVVAAILGIIGLFLIFPGLTERAFGPGARRHVWHSETGDDHD